MNLPSALRLESNPGLASIVRKLAHPFWQGLAVALLFISEIAAAYFGYMVISNTNSYSSYGAGISSGSQFYDLWTIVLFTTTVLIALFVLFILPLVWGRPYGWKRVIQIFGYALFCLFIILAVFSFILYKANSSTPSTPAICNAGPYSYCGNPS